MISAKAFRAGQVMLRQIINTDQDARIALRAAVKAMAAHPDDKPTPQKPFQSPMLNEGQTEDVGA